MAKRSSSPNTNVQLFEELSAAVDQRTFRNGEQNKLLQVDRPVHSWYRFILSFPPHLVREYLSRFKVGPRHVVLDPFCGTGTTLVECKKLGISSIGVEAHPMAHFASSVKVDWAPDTKELVKHAAAVARSVNLRLAREGIREVRDASSGTNVPKSLTALDPEAMALLLGNSISPLPLHRVITLLNVLEEKRDDRFYAHERLAIAKVLVSSAGNLHFGPEVGVGPPKFDAPVIDDWLRAIGSIAHDVSIVRQMRSTPAAVTNADARRISEAVTDGAVNAVFTSPPYPNEKDYTRTTRLETVILGFIRNKADLRALKQGLLRSNTRTVYKGDADDTWVADHPEIERIAKDIESRRESMGKTSGFERLYPKVTKLYFGGMARHLAELRQVLRPGAKLAYVVGDQASYLRVMIRTGQILSDLARSLGYQVEGIDLFRTRLATATKEQLREEIVLLRWPG